MVRTFKPAQLLPFAIRIALLLALGQAAVLADGPSAYPEPSDSPQSTGDDRPSPEAVPAPEPGPRQFLATPVLNENRQAPAVPPAAPAATDRPLPINLATALCLSNARPLVIAFAENSVELAAVQLQHAKVLWLPNFNTGVDYYRHDGYIQETQGPVIDISKSSLAVGAGATLDLGITDAIFLPLAARQELSSREFDLEAARNDALATVATAYFDVQEARGRLAGNLDAIAKGKELEKQVKGLAGGGAAGGLVPQVEIDRVLALLYDLEQESAASRAAWQTSSARLNRVLRLNPGAVVVPIEPPQLQVTLIPPGRPVDDLIPVGLLNRPELASHKALVQATLERLRQERLRPLLPSVVLGGGSGPGGAFTGGLFEGSPNNDPYVGGARFDIELSAVWTLDNLGAGNRALVRERSVQQQRALLGLFDTQDRVAEEVVQAHAQLEAAAVQVGQAEAEVREANITLAGTRIGLREPLPVGGLLQLVNRPQEAVAALQQLDRAYDVYFAAVNGYNRAQFQLYRAMGYPARSLICDCPLEKLQEVDTSRPPYMPPVCPNTISRPCPCP
jgi:outer membrane protein TolC